MNSLSFHRGRPYGLILIPFLALSFCAHAGTFGGYVWVQHGIGGQGDANFKVESLAIPKGGTIKEQLAQAQLTPGRRPKNYRLSYLEKVILPREVEVVQVAQVPEPPEPAVVKQTKPKTTPKPQPKATPKPDPAETSTAGGETTGLPATDNTAVETGMLKGGDGNPLAVPHFEVFCLQDEVTRSDLDFLNYPAIYVVGDISTENGLEEMYHWVHYFHDILHMPNVVSPPYVLAIGEAVEKPDFAPIEVAEGMMKSRWNELQLFPGPVWGDVCFDKRGEFLEGVGVTKLPAPQVYVADLSGYVGIKIQGKLAELSKDEVLAIMTEIKLRWGMSEPEFIVAKGITNAWQSKLAKGELGPPVAVDTEKVPLAVPSFEQGQ